MYEDEYGIPLKLNHELKTMKEAEDYFKRLEKYVGDNSIKPKCLMIGDASGKEGQFSDTDKKTAENFGIDYMDVDDFVRYWEN